MARPERTREQIVAEDVRDLARLGYAQQLFREMGGFSNSAISFSIISILTGAARLNDVSVWWHIGGVLLIAGLLTVLGTHHNDASFLLQRVTVAPPLEAGAAPTLVIADVTMPSALFALVPGLAALYAAAPFALMFVLGLLQAQWTYTGYDASAHVAEETVLARLNSAWGVFLSVAVSAVVGSVLLLILTWCIPHGDVGATANDPYPVLQIAYGNLPRFLANVVAVVIGGAMWLCGPASITSMGRMWYAFALPPNELVLWTMLLVLAVLAVYWRAGARHRFVGPRTSAGG